MEKVAELKNILNKVHFIMYYHPVQNYLYCDWIGFNTAENIKAGALEMIKWAENNAQSLNCTCVINDNRNMTGPWLETIDWLEANWSPLMYQSGIRYNAIIQSHNSLTRLSAKEMERNATEYVTTRLLSSMEEAETWFAAQFNIDNSAFRILNSEY